MKLGDELRGEFNMDCQWGNNGFRGYQVAQLFMKSKLNIEITLCRNRACYLNYNEI